MHARSISRVGVFICIVALSVPLMPQQAGAQVPSVGSVGATSMGCPTITRTLSFGMRGNDVVQLQNFLIARGHLASGNNTGYFGALTQAAVQAFQVAQNIVTSGTPSTTGYGAVGPRTRAAILQLCGGLPSGNVPAGVSMSASPTSGNAPLNVVFTVNASAGYCGNYSLDFGDGAVEDFKNFCGSKTFSHTYNGEGTRTARLERMQGSSRTQVALANITTGSGPVSTPSCTMTLSKNTVVKGSATTLSWTSSGATKATWDDGTETGTSGSQELRDLAATTVKSITFRGEGGTKKCSVTVTVTAPPTGTVTVTGNATANCSVFELPTGGQSAFKLAEFQLKTGTQEAVTMKKLVFTLRNQTTDRAPGAAKVSNYRVTVGTASYPVSVAQNGVYETGTVSLGSGVTVAANQSVGVAIFADVVPNSGGHLDLWVYPADTQFTGVTSGAAITPTSQVTNRVDSELLYWSGWISVVTPKPTATTEDKGPLKACYMDGKGFDVETPPANCAAYGGAADARTPPEECKKYQDATPVCTAQGWNGNLWAGGYISLPFPVAVGCTAANEFISPYTTSRKFYVPGNMKVLGGWCTAEEGANRTDCDGQFVCKRDGWWMLDGAGNELRKLDRAPSLWPEQFYPQF